MYTIGPECEAKWDGTCPWCSGTWKKGDVIGFIDDLVACPQCVEDTKYENEYERYFDHD